MTAREILNFWRAQPFRSFEIHLSDNRSFVVEHPEFMSFSTDYRTIALSLDPVEENNYRTRELIDIRHVTSVTEDTSRRPRRRRNRKAS